MTSGDWTAKAGGGSNNSETFVRLCGEIASLLRQDAYNFVVGNVDAVASLILAQLAHVHGLAPMATLTAERMRVVALLRDERNRHAGFVYELLDHLIDSVSTGASAGDSKETKP